MNKDKQNKEWEERIAAFQASGQSVSTWCEAHQVKPHQLRYRLRKLETPTISTSQWLSVEVGEQPNETTNALLVRVGTAVIEVKPGFDLVLFTDVVRVLRTLC